MGASPDETMRMMERLMESCGVKSVMSGVAGGAMGFLFGAFMSGTDRYQPPVEGMTTMQQVRLGFRDMGVKASSYSKNFATVGFLYSGIECIIERQRAKHDLINSGSAGCITGGILAARAGPQAAAFGCAGFAAFSVAIDYYMEGGFGDRE